MPSLQASSRVQTLPSVQGLVFGALAQPLSLSQLSSVHRLPSLQLFALPAPHLPSAHASPSVQMSPSLQGAALVGCRQPTLGSQLSSVQTLPSSHLSAPPPTHLPSAHLSPAVQASPSLQAAVLLVLLQPLLGSQVSVVHGLESSHLSTAPGLQTPAAQTSFKVQTLPSSQALTLFL